MGRLYMPSCNSRRFLNSPRISTCILGTVKLGYNDHGYNEFTFITNRKLCQYWSQIIDH